MTGASRTPLRDAVDGLRMAGGTLTIVPVSVRRFDRTVAGWAMALAPLVGIGLGAAAALPLSLAGVLGLGPLLASALAVGLLAVLTRGLHLDGLADLADGLGSARPAGGALEIMRRSDIGPFGVVTLVLTVLIQVLALGELATASSTAGALGLLTAAGTGRLAITWACTPRIPAARSDGLGGPSPVRCATGPRRWPPLVCCSWHWVGCSTGPLWRPDASWAWVPAWHWRDWCCGARCTGSAGSLATCWGRCPRQRRRARLWSRPRRSDRRTPVHR